MDPPHQIRFLLTFDDPSLAELIRTSLAQDIGEIDDDRSRTSLELDDAMVEVRIEAMDLVALRAASNTWLSLATVAERTAAIG